MRLIVTIIFAIFYIVGLYIHISRIRVLYQEATDKENPKWDIDEIYVIIFKTIFLFGLALYLFIRMFYFS